MSQRKRKDRNRGGAGPLLVIVGGVVLLGAALFALFQGRGSSGGATLEVTGEPRLKVDREVIDFGEVPLGKWVTAEFRLTNVGDQPLRFSEPPWVELVEGC